MGRRLVPLTLDNLPDLPSGAGPAFLGARSGQWRSRGKGGRPELEKEAWISAVLLEWGSCGRVVYVDDVPVGFVLYAPPAYVPRSTAFPTSPVSPDAVQLMTAWIMPGYQGQGLGRVIVQTVAKDLLAAWIQGDRGLRGCPLERAGVCAARGSSSGGGLQDRASAPTLSSAAAGAAHDALLEGRRGAGAGPAAGSGPEGARAATAVSASVRQRRARPA